MHIKLIEQGFETMTGFLGEVEFENGTSVENLSRAQVERIAGSLRVETIDGEHVGAAHDLLDRTHTAPELVPTPTQAALDILADQEKTEEELGSLLELADKEPLQTGESSNLGDSLAEGTGEGVGQVVEDPATQALVDPSLHTAESLGAVADADGIQGLRDIAEPLNVKGNSIAKLIEGILAAQVKG